MTPNPELVWEMDSTWQQCNYLCITYMDLMPKETLQKKLQLIFFSLQNQLITTSKLLLADMSTWPIIIPPRISCSISALSHRERSAVSVTLFWLCLRLYVKLKSSGQEKNIIEIHYNHLMKHFVTRRQIRNQFIAKSWTYRKFLAGHYPRLEPMKRPYFEWGVKSMYKETNCYNN